MKRKLTFAVLLILLITPLIAQTKAQAAPTPPDVPTLGPIKIYYTEYSPKSVRISSPINQSVYSSHVQLVFTVEATGMLGQFGNVGYSLDGGTIYNVSTLG